MFYCDRRGEQIAKKYIVCHMHTTKGRKKMPKPKPELKPQKHFHRWMKKTGVYVGTATTTTGAPPVDNLVHDYEEFEPPPRKDPDGWYVIRHRANGSLRQFARKDGPTIRDITGKVISEYWCDYTVEAYIPHVEWVVDEEENKA